MYLLHNCNTVFKNRLYAVPVKITLTNLSFTYKLFNDSDEADLNEYSRFDVFIFNLPTTKCEVIQDTR